MSARLRSVFFPIICKINIRRRKKNIVKKKYDIFNLHVYFKCLDKVVKIIQ